MNEGSILFNQDPGLDIISLMERKGVIENSLSLTWSYAMFSSEGTKNFFLGNLRHYQDSPIYSIISIYFCLFWGSHLEVCGIYSCLCAQGISLGGAWGTI